MNEAFFQRAADVRSRMPIGFIGEFVRSHDFRSITGINSDPQAKQVVEIVVDTATNARRYAYSVDGAEVVFVATAADKAVIAAGLAAAHNATAGARRLGVAESDGVDTVTITGVWPGVAFDVTGVDAQLTATTTTAAATADAIDFGRAVIAIGQVEGEGVPSVAVPTTARFSAQVISHTFAGGAGAYFSGVVRVNGKTYPWQADWNADLNTTCADIAAAINAVLPANTVLAASVGGGVVTLTAEVAGAEFESEVHASGAATAAAATAYTTGPSNATSLRRALLGFSVRRLDVESTTVGGPGKYAPNGGVEIATRGRGVLQRETTEAWARGDDVYVSVAEATKGRLYNAAGANRVWIGRDLVRIERSEPSTSSDGVGVVSIDMGA